MLSISYYTMLCISVYWLSCQFIVLGVGLYYYLCLMLIYYLFIIICALC